MAEAVVGRRSGTRLGAGVVFGAVAAAVVSVAPVLFRDHLAIDPALVVTLGYPAVFLVNALGSLTLLLPVPGLAVVFAGGSLLNPVTVALVAAAGMSIGMIGTYLLGRSGESFLKAGEQAGSNRLMAAAARVTGWLKRYGVLAAFLLAAVPNPVFDFAGLMAGAARMPLWKFLLGTFLGKALQALVVALAGFYMASTAL